MGLAVANCITIDGFSQHNRRQSKKLRSCGGFEPVSPLSHMNRQNRDAGITKNKKTKP